MSKFLPGPEALFVLGLIVIAPGALAWLVTGGRWLQVLCAFALWFVALFMFLGGGSVSRDEGIGWTLIMSMFFGWAGVPLAALALRFLNIPYRFM